MFDYEHDRMSKLYQSVHIHHQTETQQTVRQGEEFLWSVYLWLICLPSWVPEAELCSALPVPLRCRQTDKPPSPQCLQLSWGPGEALQTVVAPWQTTPSLILSSLLLSRIFVLGLKSRIRKSSGWRGRWPVHSSLSFPGSVTCESRQSGSALLARLGFAAISRRDLHCRVCRGREESQSGSREAWTEMEEKLENWPVTGPINLNTTWDALTLLFVGHIFNPQPMRRSAY